MAIAACHRIERAKHQRELRGHGVAELKDGSEREQTLQRALDDLHAQNASPCQGSAGSYLGERTGNGL